MPWRCLIRASEARYDLHQAQFLALEVQQLAHVAATAEPAPGGPFQAGTGQTAHYRPHRRDPPWSIRPAQLTQEIT